MTNVLLDQPRPGIAQITLNRPERRNALTYETLDQLFNLFDQIDADHDTRVVVLTGAGRGFCSGADLALMDEKVDPNGLGLLGIALDKAEEILANTPFGVAMTKQVPWSQLEVASLKSGIELEARTQMLALMTEDLREQALAAVERRRPIYRNR